MRICISVSSDRGGKKESQGERDTEGNAVVTNRVIRSYVILPSETHNMFVLTVLLLVLGTFGRTAFSNKNEIATALTPNGIKKD